MSFKCRFSYNPFFSDSTVYSSFETRSASEFLDFLHFLFTPDHSAFFMNLSIFDVSFPISDESTED